MILLSDAVLDAATGTYAVTRRRAPTVISGVQVPDPAPQALQVEAAVFPAKPAELQRLAEGRRSSDLRAVLSVVPLFAQSDLNAADQIQIGGDLFEVSEVEAWGDGMGSDFWRALCLRAGRLGAGQP